MFVRYIWRTKTPVMVLLDGVISVIIILAAFVLASFQSFAAVLFLHHLTSKWTVQINRGNSIQHRSSNQSYLIGYQLYKYGVSLFLRSPKVSHKHPSRLNGKMILKSCILRRLTRVFKRVRRDGLCLWKSSS